MDNFNHVMKSGQEIKFIPVSEIYGNLSQPRTIFEYDSLVGLSRSIVENGIIQPLIVKAEEGNYRLVAGERRLKASLIAGIKEVPCIVSGLNEEESLFVALIENIQREKLHFFDEANAVLHIIKEYGYTQENIAKKIGKSQGAIANKLRLLKLSSEIQKIIKDNNLTERHGRALLRLENDESKKLVLKLIISKKLNVQQTDRLVEETLTKTSKKGKRVIILRDVRIFLNTINKAIETMKDAGIDANVKKNEEEDYIEYSIKIPKKDAVKNKVKKLA